MPRPLTGRPPSAHLYPEGGPGRQLKGRLQAGEVLLAGVVAEYVRPSIMKFYQQAGLDFVFIEYEHAYFDPPALSDTVLSGRDSGLPVIAKTPQLERAEVAKLMECGVVGIQLPRTESREEVETLLSYMKFPPAGTRALASGYGNSDYMRAGDRRQWMAEQDAESTVIAQIETRAGYEKAEEIVTTPGVDMVYVGPGDFSVEMGQPGNAEHPDVRGPMEEILQLCKSHGIPFGTTAANMEAAKRWTGMGAAFFETSDERFLIMDGAAKIVSDFRQFLD